MSLYRTLLTTNPSLKGLSSGELSQKFPTILTPKRWLQLCNTIKTISKSSNDNAPESGAVNAEFIGLLFLNDVLFDEITAVICQNLKKGIIWDVILDGMAHLFAANILNKDTFGNYLKELSMGSRDEQSGIRTQLWFLLEANCLNLNNFNYVVLSTPIIRRCFLDLAEGLRKSNLLKQDILTNFICYLSLSEAQLSKLSLVVLNLGNALCLSKNVCLLLQDPQQAADAHDFVFDDGLMGKIQVTSNILAEYYDVENEPEFHNIMYRIATDHINRDAWLRFAIKIDLSKEKPASFVALLQAYLKHPLHIEAVSAAFDQPFDLSFSVFHFTLKYPHLARVFTQKVDNASQGKSKDIAQGIIQELNAEIKKSNQALQALIIIALSPSGREVFGNLGALVFARINSYTGLTPDDAQNQRLANRYHFHYKRQIGSVMAQRSEVLSLPGPS